MIYSSYDIKHTLVPETACWPGMGLHLERKKHSFRNINAYHSELEKSVLCLFMVSDGSVIDCHLR
jgi:hypothetical protein